MNKTISQKILFTDLRKHFPFAISGTGIIFPLIVCCHGFSLHTLKGLIFTVFLLLISAIDFKTQLIYDRILLPFLLFGLIFLAFPCELPISDALIAAFSYSGLFLLLRFLSNGNMGGGDIKLAFIIGIWLGPQTAPACLLAFWLGALFSIVFLLPRGISRKQKIAFGPFMAAGAIISFLFSAQLTAIYRSFIYG